LEEAIKEFQEAIRLNADYPEAHFNLGHAFRDLGRLEESIKEYREALRLKKDYPEALYNLGLLLLQQGQFVQAAEAFRRGHSLASGNPRSAAPFARLLRQAEQFVQLDARLPAVLRGEAQPKDATERLAFGQLCVYRRYYVAAAGFYDKAFTTEPKILGEGPSPDRYDAACAAALAGGGQGEDAKALAEPERARLRRQALDWLRADLAAWRQALDKQPDKVGPQVTKTMQHWQHDKDFAGVRGDSLTRLPEAERPDWRTLWEEVEALGKRAAK
jgi:tetratricopeptide (TPR) repeat protein